MRNLILFLLLLCFSPNIFATNVSGAIYSNTTWNKSGSPYTITGDVVVFAGATLSIEAGVEVIANASVMVEIRGRMVAAGTASDNIRIRGNCADNVKDFWKGIVFYDVNSTSKGQADLKYCHISNAAKTFNFDLAYGGPYKFRNCLFTQNYSVNYDGGLGGMLFDSCTFRNNYEALGDYFQFGGRASNCWFDSNTVGVYGGPDTIINCKFTYNKRALSPYGYVNGCEVYENEMGVKCPFNSENNVFINNKVKRNGTGVEIESYFNGYITFKDNEICDNYQYNIKLSHKNDADLSGNCWCSTDSAAIRSKIYDGLNDLSRGLVNFMPFKQNCNTSVPTAPTPSSSGPALTVYPNPSTTGFISLNASAPILLNSISVTDLRGKTVNLALQKTTNSYLLNLQHASKGIYFVSVTLETGERVVQRFMIVE